MTQVEQEKQALVAVWAVDGVGVVSFTAIACFLKKHALSWSDFWQQYDLYKKAKMQ